VLRSPHATPSLPAAQKRRRAVERDAVEVGDRRPGGRRPGVPSDAL